MLRTVPDGVGYDVVVVQLWIHVVLAMMILLAPSASKKTQVNTPIQQALLAIYV